MVGHSVDRALDVYDISVVSGIDNDPWAHEKTTGVEVVYLAAPMHSKHQFKVIPCDMIRDCSCASMRNTRIMNGMSLGGAPSTKSYKSVSESSLG